MTKTTSSLAKGIAGVLLGSAIVAAQAAPTLWVYGAYGYINPYTGANTTVFTPGNLAQVDANASFSSMASMNGPLAQAYVGTSGTNSTHLSNANAQSSAAVQYDFYVTNGGVFSDLVPITITGQAFMSASGNAVASGYARVTHSTTPGGVNNGSFSNQITNWACGNTSTDCGLFKFEYQINVSAFSLAEPGDIVRVSLLAVAGLNNSPFATQVSAWVDPVITIDPTYLASHPGAGLVMDASITNAMAPVPEPAGWAMLLAGLVAVGRLRRRRS